MIKGILRKYVPYKTRNQFHNLIHGFHNKSYSQEGEDMVLNRIFIDKKKGFYIDIGAHHPKRFSNTYFFYKKGWQGINIDAMPGSMMAFRKLRSRDINIEVPVAAGNKILTYYAFEEPALNGFSEAVSEERIQKGLKLLFKKQITAMPLQEILDKYLPVGQQIDFISVDVEGLDLEVLQSNNWQKYKPSVVIVEAFGSTLQAVLDSDMNRYLNSIGYIAKAKTDNTCIYTVDGFS